MSKVDILCDTDREMMLEFSRLCVAHLNNYLPLKIFLSLFQHFLDANVLKEIEKDRLIIEHAADVFERGKGRAAVDADEVFEMTKKTDREFIKRLSNPLFSMELRYDDFAEIRKRRIVSFSGMVFDLLGNWHDGLSFTDVVKRTFGEEGFRMFLHEVLHLYNVETRLLSNSITFHGPAGRARDLFAEKLFTTMERAARDISMKYARRIYAEEGRLCAEAGSRQKAGCYEDP
jgi:hypothetical protein